MNGSSTIALRLAAGLLACGVVVGANARAQEAPHPVWLDVDPSIGLPEGEVDDGLAMLQAFQSPEIHVVGVSVVFGNASLEEALPIARQVVGRFGARGLEVHSGAASKGDLGRETGAVQAMAKALVRTPLVILALGPVTNVATLVSRHPELHERIEGIVMVAARRPGQSFLTGSPTNVPHRDFNFELDPQAMREILKTSIPLTFAPWEISSQVWLRQDDLDSLRRRGEAGAWIAQSCASWLGFWQRELGVDGFNPFDTLAVAWVTHPELLECMDAGAWIEDGVDDRLPRGTSGGQKKPYLLVEAERQDARRVRYCYKPKPELKALLLDRLAGD